MKKLSIVVASVVVVFCLCFAAAGQQSKSTKEGRADLTPHVKPEDVKALPEITSLIPGVEIENVSIADIGTPRAQLVLKVKNATAWPVLMISFLTRSPSGVNTAGYRAGPDPSKQTAVIAVNQTREFRWSTNNFLDLQFPITVNAVWFLNSHDSILEVGDSATHEDVRKELQELQKKQPKQTKQE